jgi:hypothetical protein
MEWKLLWGTFCGELFLGNFLRGTFCGELSVGNLLWGTLCWELFVVVLNMESSVISYYCKLCPKLWRHSDGSVGLIYHQGDQIGQHFANWVTFGGSL